MNPRIRSRAPALPLSVRLPSLEEIEPLAPPLEELPPEARRLLAAEGLGPRGIARAPKRAELPALPILPTPSGGELLGLLRSVGRLQGRGALDAAAARLSREQLVAAQADLQAVGRMAEAVAELAGMRRQVELRRSAGVRG